MISAFCDECGKELQLAVKSYRNKTTTVIELDEGIICTECDEEFD